MSNVETFKPGDMIPDAAVFAAKLREPVALSYNAEQVNAERRRAADEIERLLARNAEHEERYSALEAREEYRKLENERLRTALKPFAEVGQWLFARPEIPDSNPVVGLPGINGYEVTLTRGHFKAAHSALGPEQSPRSKP
ncbi:MAG: hypothetical protein LC750_00595 [Actinobacteria bacterium]|nr:hypothetical protein [Actinomycetota bacterium]